MQQGLGAHELPLCKAMEAPASLESQVEGLKAQRGQLQQLLAASGGADPTLQSLLGQLDGTIEALEAEILKQRKVSPCTSVVRPQAWMLA